MGSEEWARECKLYVVEIRCWDGCVKLHGQDKEGKNWRDQESGRYVQDKKVQERSSGADM